MKVVAFGKNTVPLQSYRSHAHKYWEVVLQLSGHVSTTVDDRTFLFSEGDILVIPPNIYHSGVSDEMFTNMYFGIENLDFSEPFTVHDTDGGVLSLMTILYKILCKQESNYALLTDSLANSIYQYIKKYAGKKTNYPFVERLQDIICNNLDNPDFDLSAEIENMGFCSDYLRRCFKENTNQTPLEYLTQLRLSLACNLLTEDNFIGISNISYRCGFKDPFYFTTCFKKHMGCTPSQYRKNSYIFPTTE